MRVKHAEFIKSGTHIEHMLTNGLPEFMFCGRSNVGKSSFINAFPNNKLLNYSYFEQIKDMFPSMLLSAVMGAIVFFVTFIGLPDILTLLIQVPLGVVIYVAGAKIFKFESFEYMIKVLKGLFKKNKPNQVKSKEVIEDAENR